MLEGFGEDDSDNTNMGANANAIENSRNSIFPAVLIPNLIAHILAYAEMLDTWSLTVQRAELLKCLLPEIIQVYIKRNGHVFTDVGRDRLRTYSISVRMSDLSSRYHFTSLRTQ